MTRTHAWAVVGKDGHILFTRVSYGGDKKCYSLATFDTKREAREIATPKAGERVVRVMIETMEE